MKKAFFSVLTALVLVLAGNGQAAVIDVPGDMSLQSALNTAASNGENDTIYIAPGTYNASGSTFSYTPDLGPPEEDYSLTIIGSGAGNTILDGGNSVQIMNITTAGLVDDSNSHVTVAGIRFQNGNKSNGGPRGGGALIVETNNADITVEDCGFFNNDALGFDTHGGGAYLYSPPREVWGDPTDPPPFVPPGGDVTLTNNIFGGNNAGEHGGGAVAASFTGAVTFINNVFDGNTAGFAGGGARASTSTGPVTFTNNTITGNTATGVILSDLSGGGGLHVRVRKSSATVNIYNNIAWGNTTTDGYGDDIYVHADRDLDGTPAPVYLYNNDYSDFFIWGGDPVNAGNNRDSDPLLSADFHLQAGSPCIDTGTDLAPQLPTTDFEGDPRTYDGDSDDVPIPDMGADEYGPSLTVYSPEGPITVATNRGIITDLSLVDPATLPAEGKPDASFPYGMLSFTVEGLTPGENITATITFPNDLPTNTQYWKCGPKPPGGPDEWYSIPLGSNDGDNIVTIQITDGDLGDSDVTANGQIVDPGGPAIPAPQPVGGGGGGGGGGCFIATAAYGSPLSNEVKTFKRFRDEYLLTNELGRAFVYAYYKYSPRLADFIAKHPMVRRIARIGLYPILELSKWLVGENDPKQPSKKIE